MTLTTTTQQVTYSGTGTTGPFAVPFPFVAASHLTLTQVSSAGVSSTLVLTRDYSVSGAGAATGSVTLTTALPTGATLTIQRTPPLTQGTSLANQSQYYPATVEAALDYAMMASQYAFATAAAGLRLPATTSAAAFSTTIPVAPAGGYLRVNNAGTGLEAVGVTTTAGSFVQSGTGAVTRTANAKMAERLSVKDFGATGDGTTDDSTAIQNAITQAVAVNAEVYFPAGTYVADNLSYSGSTPIKLRGAHRQASVLKHKASASADLLTLACPATVESLGFDGNQPSQTTRRAALAVNANAYPIEVRNCYFTRTANYAIKIVQMNTQLTITGCLFKALSDWPNTGPTTDVSVGIYMGTATASTVGNIRITDNDFINTAPSALSPCGIQIAGYDYTSLVTVDIIGNTFEYYGSNRGGTQPSGPIDLYEYFEKVTILGNRVAYSACGGIKVGQAGTLTITGNVLRDDQGSNATAAIFWSGGVRDPNNPSHNVVIADNVVRNWAGYAGIHVVGNTSPNYVKRVSVTGNVLDNCLIGIYADMGRDWLFADNIIARCTGTSAEMAGIVLYRPQGMIVIRGGIIADCASYAVLGDYFPNGGTIILDGIACHDNVGSHFRLYDNANTLTLVEVRNCVTTGAMTNLFQNVTRVDVLNNYFEAGAPGTASVTTYVHALNNFDVLTATNAAPGFGLIANGASQVVTTTVTGAALGDFCQASLSTDAAGLSITAYVSAANTVKTVVGNLTGAGVTPSGSLYLTVTKR